MKYLIGKVNLSSIFCFKSFFCSYYICEAISESLAVFCQISTEVWLVKFPLKVEAGILYFLSSEFVDYNWLII